MLILGIFLKVLGILLITLVGIILLLLALPISFQGRVQVQGKARGEVEVAGLGGLARLKVSKEPGASSRTRVELIGLEKKLGSGKPKDRPDQQGRASKHWNRSYLSVELLKTMAVFLRKIVADLNLHFSLKGEIGTGDPAYTGMIFSVLSVVLGGSRGFELYPNFIEAVLDIDSEFRGRVIPLVIVGRTLVMLLSAPVRSLWWPRKLNNKKSLKEVASNV